CSSCSQATVTWAKQHAATAIFEPQPSQAVMGTLLRAHDDKAAAWARILDLARADIAEQGAAHVLLSPIANRAITNCMLAALEESAQLVPAACTGALPVRALLMPHKASIAAAMTGTGQCARFQLLSLSASLLAPQL
ncbi:hypothetical protein H4R19_002623, partial [Coemansia spiralis]